MIVDTSVWVNGLWGIQTEQVTLVAQYITADQRIYSTPTILQEVLQGVQDDSRYESVKEGMMAHTMLMLDPVEAAIEAAQLYRTLRKKGITTRKPNDCLIAHYAIFYDMPILHNDADFDQIARFTALRIVTL
ncbi:PIN domain nuclease [Spirosoma sp. KNUC1025]|uniref:type II toxin-antitoxin system VapC family toxin n=1 Tax=Spirosoma sp. KNUC1025 TaxID=2894082 RepID=UPI00386A3764|nr:PIN domain nuclease [Spirosoma sp. KNUC1025]